MVGQFLGCMSCMAHKTNKWIRVEFGTEMIGRRYFKLDGWIFSEFNIFYLFFNSEGGRLSQELAYTMKILGEGSGTTSELIIQTPENGVNVLTVKSLLTHYQAVRAATRVSVDMYDEYVPKYFSMKTRMDTWHFNCGGSIICKIVLVM